MPEAMSDERLVQLRNLNGCWQLTARHAVELLTEVERLRGENAKFRELINKCVADACGEVGG